MSYSTGGSGGTLVDLMDAIRTFALGAGWTIDKWDSTNRLLFMTKGMVCVTFGGFLTENVNVYYGANASGTFTSTPDHRLRMALNTSNTVALTTYHSHPGSVVTSNTDGDAPYLNGLNGPFIGWFIFNDPTVSDHIHVVVQISAEVYMHLSFGQVDKRGLTHSGVAYVTAAPNAYFRNVSNYLNGSNQAFNSVDYMNYPFVGLGHGSLTPYQPASYNNSPSIILKNSNAWPATWGGPIIGASGQQASGGVGTSTARGLSMNLANYNGGMYRPERWPNSDNTAGMLFDFLVQAEAAPYSNVVPLFPIPCIKQHYDSSLGATSYRNCYVGDFPNVRMVNMTNLTPGQEVVVGGETFKVFPILRQTLWSDRNLYNAPSSGQYGIAYKKVV